MNAPLERIVETITPPVSFYYWRREILKLLHAKQLIQKSKLRQGNYERCVHTSTEMSSIKWQANDILNGPCCVHLYSFSTTVLLAKKRKDKHTVINRSLDTPCKAKELARQINGREPLPWVGDRPSAPWGVVGLRRPPSQGASSTIASSNALKGWACGGRWWRWNSLASHLPSCSGWLEQGQCILPTL
jgi:hypothetical protein